MYMIRLPKPSKDLLAESRARGRMSLLPSQFVEEAILVRDESDDSTGELVPFSFAERRYLKRIYDTKAKRTLLKCGRQVEKTAYISAHVGMLDGSVKEMKDVEEGDLVQGMDPDGAHTDVGRVTWKSKRYMKPCVRVRTRQGHETIVALTHPMRTWAAWTEMGELTVKDRLAVVRRSGLFTRDTRTTDSLVTVAACMIAEGACYGSPSFTQNEGPYLDDFVACCDDAGLWFVPRDRDVKGGLNWQLAFLQDDDGTENPMCGLLREWGLYDTRSSDKFVPDFVWGLDQRQTALFINRLWAGDGHASLQGSSYHLEYDSTSERLARDVQRLLWKFGIPTSFRRWKPKLYEGTDKWAYKLRVETQEGALRLITDIGALGKTEDLPLIKEGDNSNRDTFPMEIAEDIKAINRSRDGYQRRGRYVPQPSLRSAGLREKPKFPPSRDKLRQYVEFFRSDERFDQELVDGLAAHLDTDLFWDEIVEIGEPIELPCYDITVEGTDSFILDGFVTHNSTSLGNRAIAYCCLRSGWRVLYVSPSHTQTREFSTDRLKEPIETCPVVSAYTSPKLSMNVLSKEFRNRSKITLRYAFLNADRTRGIPADQVLIDEFQDILLGLVPVIEQCAAHGVGLFGYSGTPLTLDNSLSQYWDNMSTQNEWVVPCFRHQRVDTQNNRLLPYWNVLGEANIGKEGPICDKCGGRIYPDHHDARWASLNPNPGVPIPFEGYHITQLMVPWIFNKPDKWKELLHNYHTYSRQRFFNEVLGEPYDSGNRPLTREEIQKVCVPEDHPDAWKFKMDDRALRFWEEWSRSRSVWAGIDWGCHDEETRILTKDRGFQHFRDLTDEDEVAQWDPDTRLMSFTKPEVRTIRDWGVPLKRFRTKGGVDLAVTHTHRMRVKAQGDKGSWLTETAGDTASRRGGYQFVGHVGWEGEEREWFQLPGLPKSPGYAGSDHRTFRMDDWLELLGYFLSEGGLCLRKRRDGRLRPYCVKMSQRESVNPEDAGLIRACMDRMGIDYSEFPNGETGDTNWTICGKQWWSWWEDNIGLTGDAKRVPREFLGLSKRQLRILFDALMLGDGGRDPREGCTGGAYYSTSKGLCEDFQEICIRLGLRAVVRLHKPARGNRKARWRVLWSRGRDHTLKPANVEEVPYEGKVYCCKVPTGYIVTERNGCVSFQGNTGEHDSYTLFTLSTYWNDRWTVFYAKRFVGPESEPEPMLALVESLIARFHVKLAGTDFGGGWIQNDKLVRRFGPTRIAKYQYSGNKGKICQWDPKEYRWKGNRTAMLSTVFNTIKRESLWFPCWSEFENPFARDMLSVFAEYNEKLRMTQYDHRLGTSDDTLHSIVLNLFVSMLHHARPDILAPVREEMNIGGVDSLAA